MGLRRTGEMLTFLANESRRRILCAVSRRPMTVAQIAGEVKIAPSVVRYHVKRLHTNKLLKVVGQSRPRRYTIARRVMVLQGPTKVQLTITLGRHERISIITSRSEAPDQV